MFDLDEEPDDCRQSLLTIVARGTAIITELYRLVELTPEPFLANRRYARQAYLNKQGGSLLDDIIFDFSYFKSAEEIEAKIEMDFDLKRADAQFCEEHIEILTRFYLTFEAVQRHANDLNRFIIDLQSEVFIGQSLDDLLINHECRQLLSEAYFQAGYMLLLIDKRFEGNLRERLIVSYYRYSANRSSPGTNLDEACNLMRTTGYKCHHQLYYDVKTGAGNNRSSKELNQLIRPIEYPEKYLARIGCNQFVVSTLISKLQAVDVYGQTVAIFPHPDHRSNALAQQASILYVLLYFCPDILRAQKSRMREITDKFFSDNWVVHIFMGELVNLIEMWEPYRAASESLIQIHDIESARSLSSHFNVRFYRNAKQLAEYLKEGWLNEESFVDHSGRILNCIRDSNVVLKWLLLHSRPQPGWQTSKLIKSLSSEVMASQPDARSLCEFFQNLCVLEKKVAVLYDKSCELKRTKIDEQKSRACDMLEELISIFNDTKPMRWVKVGVNHGLAKILTEAQTQLVAVDTESATESSGLSYRETIVRLVNRLESARESYLDGKSLQVVQLFVDTKERLVKLLRYLDLDQNFKTILQSVCDFAYGWLLIGEVFTEPLQQIIKNNPENLFAFEAIIIKVTSAFESQLVRIQQMGAEADLISVSQYYSSKMVAFVKNVLQIIPASILELIITIMTMQAENKLALGSIPSRIHLDQLKQFALPEQRLQVIQLTCKISHYARGIIAMPDTPIGLMRIDSKRMFEEGFRRELAKSMSEQIEEILGGRTAIVTAASTQLQLSKDLLSRLKRLETIFIAYKRSLEYIQDFLFIYGLEMWQNELSHIVRTSVEQAMSALMASSHAIRGPGQVGGDNKSNSNTINAALSVRGSLSARIRTTFSGHQSESKRLALVQSSNFQTQTESSFILKILQEFLKITNPRETIYDEQASAWYDKLHQNQILDASRAFKMIGSSLGVAGLNGLDELCSTLIMHELNRLNVFINERMQQDQRYSEHNISIIDLFYILQQVRDDKLFLAETINEASFKQLVLGTFFSSLTQHRPSSSSSCLSPAAIASNNERLIDHLLAVGQLQIIRLNIQCVLSTNCRYDARHLYGCLESLNLALLTTIRLGRRSPNQQKAMSRGNSGDGGGGGSGSDYDNSSCRSNAAATPVEDGDANQTNVRSLSASLDESQLVFELTNYLDWIGLSDPMSKIYTLSLDRSRSAVSEQRQKTMRSADSSSSFRYADKNQLAFFHSILEQRSKLHYSSSNDRARPSAKKATFNSYQNKVDELPLYLGLVTLLNHFETNLVV